MRDAASANRIPRTQQASVRLPEKADKLATELVQRMNNAGRYSGLGITKAKLLALAVSRGLAVIAAELETQHDATKTDDEA